MSTPMPPASTPPAGDVAEPTPSPPPRRSRRRRITLWTAGTLLTIAALGAVAVALLWWAVNDASGTRWLAAYVPRTKITNPRGSLVGDFAADRIEIGLGDRTLRLDAPSWHALGASRGRDGRWLSLRIETLHVERLTVLPPVKPSAAAGEPDTPPASLRLPIEIEVSHASVGELHIGSAGPAILRAIEGRIHLGADGGALHRFESLAAQAEQAGLAGQLRIGADAPFPVDASLQFIGSDPSLPWRAEAQSKGPLASLSTQATVRLPASPAHGGQSLDARAVLRPFAAWPVGDLSLQASDLDLSTFFSGLPATSLSGQAQATSSGLDRPATMKVDLLNARAGRWDEGLLPVRKVSGALRAKPATPEVLELDGAQAELGSSRSAAGRITFHGRWDHAAFEVAAELAGVRTAELFGAAPVATLDGTISASGRNIIGSGIAELEVSARAAGPLGDSRWPAQAPRHAELRLEAHGSASEIAVKVAEASLGSSRLSMRGTLKRTGSDAPWRAIGQATVGAFDPFAWWPGAAATSPDSASRLDGKAEFDLVALPAAAQAGWVDRLRSLRGQADITLGDSLLAGVALNGSARLNGGDHATRLELALRAAGNRLDGNASVADAAAADQWRLDLDAPHLAALQPLLRQLPGQARDATLTGAATLQARAGGRWPELTSEGELHAKDLRYNDAALASADGHWRIGFTPNATLEGWLTASGANLAGRRVEEARIDVTGTARAHRIEAGLVSAALPPEWIDMLGGTVTTSVGPTAAPADPSSRSRLSFVAEGGLVDAAGDAAAGWRGRIGQLVAQSTAAPLRTWLSTSDVQGSIFWSGGPLRATIDAGAARVLGAALHWSRIDWQAADEARGTRARLDVEASVEPLPLAPILRRWQPDFGWGGDLAIGARISVRSAPAIVADVVVERAGGDLTVTDEYGSEALGVSAMRLALSGRDGAWTATGAIAGARLGDAKASVAARTGNGAAWPEASTPISGALEARIAEVGNWGRWLPAGWRVGGALHADARIGGRLGAPEYTGRVEGSALSVRNFVEGVAISDGEIAIALRGETAHIERLTGRAGKGALRVEGDAELGSEPRARLRLNAEAFEMLGRVDRRIVASGSATIDLDAHSLGLAGRFKIDEGLFDFTRSDAPALGEDVEVVRRPPPPPAATTVAAGSAPLPVTAAASAAAPALATRKVSLDLAVDLGDKLRIRGRGIDAGLRGELRLSEPNGRLAVAGTINAVDGTYQAYGQKLTIDRGVIAFSGALENPRLDIEATRPDIDVRAGVLVTGTALQPRVRLFSEPDMSDLDKLSWLVLGRASDTSAGRADTALLQQAALALLAGEGPGVTDRITHAIGLDTLSMRQQTEGETKETIVSLGKQISKRWYVGYERSVNTTTGNWQLIYRLAQRFTIRAQAGSDSAVDLTWTLRWK